MANPPWDMRLGAVRVYFELIEQWRTAGHEVEKFTLSDAFPDQRSAPASLALRQIFFAYKAAAFVRRNAHRFDVVDAMIGSLRGSKRQLGFSGLLVARSVGLPRLYQRNEPKLATGGRISGRIFYSFVQRWFTRTADAAIRHADLVNLPNEDEARILRQEVDVDLPIVVQPYGLTDTQRQELAAASVSSPRRLSSKKICFIGMWGPRKGALDWPKVIRQIWQRIPEAHFCFFGTLTDSENILRDLSLRSSEKIEFVPEYTAEKLSILLRDCALGLFPSYVEGFGLAVLEQLAAGIPTIAYDVPGPRQIFGEARNEFLVPAGDIEALTQRAIEILNLPPDNYETLARRCRSIAGNFRWEEIAAKTIDQYRTAMMKPGHIVFTQPFGIASVAGGGGARILRSLLRDAPLPFLCISTLPQKPDRKFDHEIHLPMRPHFGRIEHSRFAGIPIALGPLFRRSFEAKLERVCREANARAIHAIAHGGLDFYRAYLTAKKLGCPFFLQVHDDVAYTGDGRASPQMISRSLAEAWTNADARFVISKELGQEYNRRYGVRDFIVVTDGADQIASAPRPAPSQLRIYFMGLFHLEYEPNVEALTRAIDLVDLAPGVERSITLRCGFVRRHLQNQRVRVLPYGSEADVQADFAQADWLYLPLPFDDKHRPLNAYSLSTKMVTYLASGIPIVYHGPTDTAVYNLLAANRAAALITTLEPNEIASQFQHLLGSREAETYAANALELARRDFQRHQQHEKFWGPIMARLSA